MMKRLPPLIRATDLRAILALTREVYTQEEDIRRLQRLFADAQLELTRMYTEDLTPEERRLYTEEAAKIRKEFDEH